MVMWYGKLGAPSSSAAAAAVMHLMAPACASCGITGAMATSRGGWRRSSRETLPQHSATFFTSGGPCDYGAGRPSTQRKIPTPTRAASSVKMTWIRFISFHSITINIYTISHMYMLLMLRMRMQMLLNDCKNHQGTIFSIAITLVFRMDVGQATLAKRADDQALLTKSMSHQNTITSITIDYQDRQNTITSIFINFAILAIVGQVMREKMTRSVWILGRMRLSQSVVRRGGREDVLSLAYFVIVAINCQGMEVGAQMVRELSYCHLEVLRLSAMMRLKSSCMLGTPRRSPPLHSIMSLTAAPTRLTGSMNVLRKGPESCSPRRSLRIGSV